MRVLCSSVLAIEAIVVLLATSLATSAGSVANTALAWAAGLTLMVLLFLRRTVPTLAAADEDESLPEVLTEDSDG